MSGTANARISSLRGANQITSLLEKLSTPWISTPMFGRTPRNFTPIVIDGGKRLSIPLTKGKFAVIDAEDLDLIGTRPWLASKSQRANKWYATQSAKIEGKKSIRLMHRVIMGVDEREQYGRNLGRKIEVDHRNRLESLNNTRENLRIATRSQQNYNTKVRKSSVSGFKGVRLRPAAYQAYLVFNGKKYSFGYFKDPAMAARARDRGAIQLQGEFASLNFPRADYGDVPPYEKVDLRKNGGSVNYQREIASQRPAAK